MTSCADQLLILPIFLNMMIHGTWNFFSDHIGAWNMKLRIGMLLGGQIEQIDLTWTCKH